MSASKHDKRVNRKRKLNDRKRKLNDRKRKLNDRKRKLDDRKRRSVGREARHSERDAPRSERSAPRSERDGCRRERDRRLRNRKRRIEYRLRDRVWPPRDEPMLAASNIHYELSDKARGLSVGGIGVMHLMALRVGLIDRIDAELKLLKVHLPYHESDHVLNIAYNILSGGRCIEDVDLRRNDEVYLDAVGAERIPDPTTAGDFCRRFTREDVESLMDAINETRVPIWRGQPDEFFEEAKIDMDGSLAPTSGQCKEGIGLSYDGQWGYHPLIISLANTKEPLYLVNRSGNRPSHESAWLYADGAIELCRRAGFRKILLRGDTDFSQTRYLDRWDEEGVRFIFGIDAMPNLKKIADDLPESAWKPLKREPKYTVKTEPRGRRENVRERIVVEKEYDNIKLVSEDVAEIVYRPTACKKDYRLVVVRKNLSVEKGERVLFDDIRYFFYITNDGAGNEGEGELLTPLITTPCQGLTRQTAEGVTDKASGAPLSNKPLTTEHGIRVVKGKPSSSREEIVALANDRCDQENLIAQLKGGVRALAAPVDNLVSNWAYMVMASLAWTLKAWFALSLPEQGRWAERHRSEKRCVQRMEFKTFLNAFIRVPCQIIRAGRRIVYRLLAWNPWQNVFLRGVDAVRSMSPAPLYSMPVMPQQRSMPVPCPMRC